MRQLIQAASVTLLLLLSGGNAFAQAVDQRSKAPAREEGTVENPIILMKTSMGDITIELFRDKAPTTVENIVGYVEEKFYDGTIFHRVIPGFMIQGGGFTEELVQKKAKDPIQNEANNGLSNTRGTVAMARMNPPHTASCQFFINVADNLFLDYFDENKWGYCVFGEVIEGMDVVEKIKDVKTGRREPLPSDVPLETVLIESVTLKE